MLSCPGHCNSTLSAIQIIESVLNANPWLFEVRAVFPLAMPMRPRCRTMACRRRVLVESSTCRGP
eukprot:1099092-Alexandrium_andersonii.AAC.1